VKSLKISLLASAVALVCGNAYAITATLPSLDAGNYTAAVGTLTQDVAPFALAPGWKAEKITDRATLTANFGVSAGGEFQASFGNWDMLDVDPSGRYVFLPFEVTGGAGLVRYDRVTGTPVTLMGGNNTRSFDTNPNDGWDPLNDDFQRFDPNTYTPAGTLITGEEEPTGRMFEVLNPLTAADRADTSVRWLSNVPAVHHEGIRFDSMERMYFVDENNSGSIYRMTPNTSGDYSSGKVEVLVDNDMTANPGANYSDAANQADGARTGAASWVTIIETDGSVADAVSAAGADPFDYGSAGGRTAADAVDATPYGRPEDIVIGNVNGDEILYVALTSEDSVIGVNLATDDVFVAAAKDLTTDATTGLPVVNASGSTYGFNNPDNLELTYSPDGEIQLFIIEDQNPGDIWIATDTNADGAMDEIQLFLTLGEFGSEPTGLLVDSLTGGFLVNVQHPGDGNDALWSVTPVPVPAAVWMMGSALLGLVGVARRKKA
jgi:hypothetical protein